MTGRYSYRTGVTGVYYHDYGGGPFHHGYSVQHSTDDSDCVLGVLGEVLHRHKDKL